MVVVVAAVLVSAGCSSKYSEDSGSSGATVGNRTVKPVEGCGKSSWTDPADLSPTRVPARCLPLAPSAQP
ncbi:hypothetical protein JHN47_51190, partial [Streptomyces sp. MBT62]|nr:hypothetical protein [Streptomyces sp. MBT62]